MSSFLNFLGRVKLQLGLLAFLLTLRALGANGLIPTEDNLFAFVTTFFEKHGLPAVALCSFVENLVGVNVYFPGSIVILTAMALSAGNLTLAFATFAAIVLPTFFSHSINFWIGRSFRRKESSSAHVKNRSSDTNPPGYWEFLFALWHPHTAAVVCIRAGSTGLTIRQFIQRFLPASGVWNLTWAIIMYHVGGVAKSTGGVVALIYIYIFAWLAWDFWLWRRQSH